MLENKITIIAGQTTYFLFVIKNKGVEFPLNDCAITFKLAPFGLYESVLTKTTTDFTIEDNNTASLKLTGNDTQHLNGVYEYILTIKDCDDNIDKQKNIIHVTSDIS